MKREMDEVEKYGGKEIAKTRIMEAGKNARRRMSATSTTTTTNDDEASTELLHPVTSHGDTPRNQSRLHSNVWKGDKSKWLRQLGIVFSALLLILLSVSSFEKLSHHASKISETSSNLHGDENQIAGQHRMLGIQLHPQDHASRAPKTITHYWNITSGVRSPDGVKKEVYLVNDQFPGPTIECRSGDRLVIHVTNNLSSGEGVSIHWHGLHMRNANAMDGAVGFTQCPIGSGTTFVYEFEVDEDQAGTFWWHAHSQVQRGDGMYGGLVVHKPSTVNSEQITDNSGKDILLMIGDWYHRSANEVLAWYMSTRGFGNEPVPDSLLMNGAGKFICSMAVPARPVECVDIPDEDQLAVFDFDIGRGPIRLRVVNVGSLAGFTLQLSSGTFTPVTVDGGFPIRSGPSNSVGILYPGERVELFLDHEVLARPNPPHLLVNLDPENFKYPNSALRSNQSFPLIAGAQIQDGDPGLHFDLATATAIEPQDSHFQSSDVTQGAILLYTKTQKLAKLSNHPTGFINRTSWSPQNTPPIPLLALPRSQWDENQLVPWVPLSEGHNLWVDIIINNLDDGAHPFHLHGNDFYVLGAYRSEHGWGSYSPFETSGSSSIKPKLNLKTPLRKDTVSVPRRGYAVLRFRPDNPGVWMFHCHILFHQASGMAMGFLIGRDEEHENFDLNAKSLCG